MITLASDFGDPYPAAMRGVVLECTEDVDHLVDVTHQLPRGNVPVGAFWLAQLLPWFPPAVHIAVVDPGVGTDRGVLVARVDGHAIVAPDNGLVLSAARAIALEDHRVPPRESPPAVALGTDPSAPIELFEYVYSDPASQTFHGRDVFAPVGAAVHAAGVANLEDIEAVRPARSYVDYQFPPPRISDDDIVATVLAIDDFGNAITNVPKERLPERETIRVDNREVALASSYADVPRGAALVTVGSHDNAELAVHDGRGDAAFDVDVGHLVTLSR